MRGVWLYKVQKPRRWHMQTRGNYTQAKAFSDIVDAVGRRARVEIGSSTLLAERGPRPEI